MVGWFRSGHPRREVLPRVQRIHFATAELFQREHTSNLTSGGVFVKSSDRFTLRERVTIELVLQFCNKKIGIEGEVVHIVPPEMASAGAEPGAAIQFLGTPSSRTIAICRMRCCVACAS
jgi:Tfp pilus assembly protein PilZ